MKAQMTNVPKKYHVLNVAHDLFNQFGFNTVGIDRILSESKTAKMTFYKIFNSKKNLINTVVEREISDQKSSLINELNKIEEGDKKSKLEIVYFWHSNFTKKENFNGCLINKATVELWMDDEIRLLIKDFYDWKYEKIKSCLTEDDKLKTNLFYNLFNSILLPSNQKIIQWKDIEYLI